MRILQLFCVVLVSFCIGCSERVQHGDANSANVVDFEKWGIPFFEKNDGFVWIKYTLNHRNSLVVYTPMSPEQWAEIVNASGEKESPIFESEFSALRKAMYFAEPFLAEELDQFSASTSISPMVSGFRQQVVYDEIEQTCIFFLIG